MCPKWFCNNTFFSSSLPSSLTSYLLFLLCGMYQINKYFINTWMDKNNKYKAGDGEYKHLYLTLQGFKYAILFDPLIGS